MTPLMASRPPSPPVAPQLDRATLLDHRRNLTAALEASPYDVLVHLERAATYAALGYPDLAAGDAYRALLLTDEVLSDDFEFHEQALDALKSHPIVEVDALEIKLPDGPDSSARPPQALEGYVRVQDVDWGFVKGWAAEGMEEIDGHLGLVALATVRAFQILASQLEQCGCLASAWDFCTRGLQMAPSDQILVKARDDIQEAAKKRMGENVDMNVLPDRGLVRREVYPWNDHEPDRFSDETLAHLNQRLETMAPKCEVRVATLPVLIEDQNNAADDATTPIETTCKQLGLFAKEDISSGEVVLREYSLITASNRLKDSFCDACSTELPGLGQSRQNDTEDGPVNCPECHDAVFCNDFCFEQAQARYHPAVCDLTGLDTIAKDPEKGESDDALYLLLLARVLAIAAHEEMHPLDVPEVRFLWGDFLPSSTLPFTFKYNIADPLHVLEKMDIDTYAEAAWTDLWVLNTLYAKFRGVASARKSTRDGRPDVAAVHPFWCLANHDCDPNVQWEWGGKMVLSAREERVDLGDGTGTRVGGLKKGEEVLNNYCDIDMAVQDRREWARGSLGGYCQCLRCRREAGEVV